MERNVEKNDREQNSAKVAYDERHDRRSHSQQEEGPVGSSRHVHHEEADDERQQSSCRGVRQESSAERKQTYRPGGAERMLAHVVSSVLVGHTLCPTASGRSAARFAGCQARRS